MDNEETIPTVETQPAEPTEEPAEETEAPAPAEPVTEPVAADVHGEPVYTIEELTTPTTTDNEEQVRLKGVFAEYFTAMPERTSWEDTKKDMLRQLTNAETATEVA